MNAKTDRLPAAPRLSCPMAAASAPIFSTGAALARYTVDPSLVRLARVWRADRLARDRARADRLAIRDALAY